MATYASQEDAIYSRATQESISHEVVYDHFVKVVNRVAHENPGKPSNLRLAEAEELVWEHFFSNVPFPGKMMIPLSASPVIKMELKVEEMPGFIEKQVIKAEPEPDNPSSLISPAGEDTDVKLDVSEPFKPPGKLKTFTGSGIFNDLISPFSSSPISLIENASMISKPPGYASQAKVITSKASSLHLQINNFQSIFKEKHRIAENRFPTESPDWQAWFAESMVWSFYFKDEAFPGLEPNRLYPLRSGVTGRSISDNKNMRILGGKWIKLADSNPHYDTGTKSTPMADLYRPSDSVICHSADRGVPAAVDSYRPGSSSSSNRPHSVNKSCSLDRSASLNNSMTMTSQRPTRVASANHSVNQKNSTGPASAKTYTSNEKVMEWKAIKLGIRREFFQHLQKARDEVRADHPDCSSQYRHWAADTMIWTKFFNKDAFPTSRPRDSPDAPLHARRCPMSQESLSRSERTSKPSTRPSQLVAPRQSLNSSGQSAIPKIKSPDVTPPTNSFYPSERLFELPPKPQVPQPPLALTLTLSNKRLDKEPPISNQTRAIMVNSQITWTTTTSVKRVADMFRTIDASLLDMIENNLKCHLRSFHTLYGDLIIWNEAFLCDDNAAIGRGSQFLIFWFDLKHSGRPETVSSSADCWEKFVESEKLTAHHPKQLNDFEKLRTSYYDQFSDSDDKKHQGGLVINGTTEVIIPCPKSTVIKITRDIQNEEGQLREMKRWLEADILVVPSEAGIIKTLTFKLSRREDNNASAIETASILLVDWAMKASLDHSYLLSTHWKTHFPAHTQPLPTSMNSGPSSRANNSSNPQASEKDWETYASMFQATDLDRLMIEEAAKAEGSLRLVFDELSRQVVGLAEFARRAVHRAKENHSLETSDCDQNQLKMDISNCAETIEVNRSAEVTDSSEHCSEKLKDSDRHSGSTLKQDYSKALSEPKPVSKRKADEDVDHGGSAEKRAKIRIDDLR